MGRTRLLVLDLLGLLALLAAAPLLAGTAAAQTSLGLRGLTCDGLTVSGEGLPPTTRFTLTILNPNDMRALAQRGVTTTPTGTISTQVTVSLSGLSTVRATLRRPGANPIWTEQSLPLPCPLAATGGTHIAPLLTLALAAVALGVVLVNTFAYQGRHLTARGTVNTTV